MTTFHTTADDGASLAYEVIGDGETHVVLIHGWMMSGAVWRGFAEHLDGLRLIVPDLRGTGGSDAPATGYSLARYAQDVLQVLTAAGADKVVVVGHSMGGQIAQAVAASLGARARGLALLNSVPASGMQLPADADGLFRSAGGDRGKLGIILGLACKQLDDAAKERLLDIAEPISAACIVGAYEAWTGGGLEHVLPRIESPTLVLATDDPFLPADFLRAAIVAPIANARLVTLPGPGHYPAVERPAETAAIVSAFIAGLG